MSKSILTATPATLELDQLGSIPPDWILSGNPKTRRKVLGRSPDWTSNIVVWECAAGSYKWHYNQDEVVIVISGGGFMTNEKGEERWFGPGDVGFFPSGTWCTWRHPDHFRKVAVLKESMWRPLGFSLKVWNKLVRTALTGKSPLMLAVVAWISLKFQ
jgi:uncharacterized cupin superfamily protein